MHELSITRRGFLATSFPWSIAAAAGSRAAFAAAPQKGLVFDRAHPFSFEWLRAHAKALARSSYKPLPKPAWDIIRTINFEVSQKINFRPEDSLWPNGPGSFPIRFFPLKEMVPYAVKIHALSGGMARRIIYRPQYFDWGGTGLDRKLPPNLDFSGFRAMNGPGVERDWLAFQGASYFRTSGSDDQYGASARGIAVDTALSTREEFPNFTEFWIEEGQADSTCTVYALLDGPSITGAYKIVSHRGQGVVMDIHADLFARADIQRLGIAPLTSMYWYSENDRRRGEDWRPEIHDSDGLAMWTGAGERIWRPLVNPPSVQTNSFLDKNPKGFGLLQRDRDFNNYQDDGTFYDKRPSIWVEPRGNWGEGAVQLVEIPTDDETHDNIVAYWLPKAPVQSGAAFSLDYRLYWQDPEPHISTNVARVVATRIGRAGIPGGAPEPDGRKFVIDFEGGALADLQPRYDITPVITLSRGKPNHPYVVNIVGTHKWRAFFDVIGLDGKTPVDMRCFLRLGNKTLTETWLYQYFPV